MSNLESAKAAIEAELSHAKQGLSYYKTRIAALELTLSQLASVTGSSQASSAAKPPGKRGPKAGAGKRAKLTTKKKEDGVAGGNDLPRTGGEYWPNLVLDKPRSASEILQASIAGLGFSPSKEQIQKLAGRMTFALNALVKAKKIQDSGSGRERRFFKS